MEGEKRPSYLAFLKKYEGKGLYALYQEENLYYVGKASNLKTRIDQHLKDEHGENWDRFAMYMFADKTNSNTIHLLESLMIRIARPQGNKRDGRISGSLQKELEKYLLSDAKNEIKAIIHGVSASEDVGSKDDAGRLTAKKLRNFLKARGGQTELSKILSITPQYVNTLISQDKTELTSLRQLIADKGLREKVLEATGET